MSVLFHPEAEREFNKAIEYYEELKRRVSPDVLLHINQLLLYCSRSPVMEIS